MIDVGEHAEQSTRQVVREQIAFHAAQREFFNAVRSERFLYLLYGGAIQGGKSTVTFMTLFALCKIFPGSRWAIVRKDGPTLARNTIPQFNRLRPANFCGPPTGKTLTAKCTNGSEILFFPENRKEDPDYDRWKGLIVSGFLLEEANELSEATFDKAIERAGTLQLRGSRQPKPYVMLTCNPARNWVLQRFYLPWKQQTLTAPYYFQRALPQDNPHLTAAYRESLKNLPKAMYDRFVNGDWDVLDDPTQLITFDSLIAATKLDHIKGTRGLGVDVARFGDDHSCIAEGETGPAGTTLFGLDRYQGVDVHALSERVMQRIAANAVNTNNVRIDSIGVGAGVVDNCRAKHFAVQEFVASASAPVDPRFKTYRFKNRRSWAWWKLREDLLESRVCIDVADTSRLFQDLAAPRYRITGDKVIEVESKDATVKRIGRSPDEGDAVVMLNAHDPTAIVYNGDLGFGRGRAASRNRFA